MLAKLIVHAPTRAAAIERMERALGELRVVGVETSVPFHLRVMREPDFRAGRLDIRYLEKHESELLAPLTDEATLRAAALAAALLQEEKRERRGSARLPATATEARSAWAGRGSWNGR
jgi:acetyl/propionyl-CoA carboxylase alpha subunit